ncbi:MAG: hypothetical protein KUG71_10615 [Porticoccaceae bacterium]|nr:hypothetical protein [Porticoccaceae bacterium]
MNRIKINPVKLIPILFLLAACSPSEQEQSKTQEIELIPFTPAGDVKYTMQWVLDPAADHIWDSAGTIITAAGSRELAPTTDEGWLAVQHSAAVVAETGNLLMMPGRARDDGDWRDISLGLVAAGLSAQAAAEAHDSDALFDAGGQIYRVCTSCHSAYIHDVESAETP